VTEGQWSTAAERSVGWSEMATTHGACGGFVDAGKLHVSPKEHVPCALRPLVREGGVASSCRVQLEISDDATTKPTREPTLRSRFDMARGGVDEECRVKRSTPRADDRLQAETQFRQQPFRESPGSCFVNRGAVSRNLPAAATTQGAAPR
jgi:hypothetical protein